MWLSRREYVRGSFDGSAPVICRRGRDSIQQERVQGERGNDAEPIKAHQYNAAEEPKFANYV